MRKIVIFRHGIVINRWFMEPMARYLRRRGWEVRNRTYPTTRKLIEEHARDLCDEAKEIEKEAIASGGPFELYAVTQSMGGLVLRHALTHLPMPRLRRAVLMVPPNQGSAAGRHYRDFLPYRWIFGTRAGAQLASDPPGIFAECGVPEGVEVGILAGDIPRGFHPFELERPHDGVVAAAEARLPPFPLKLLPFGHTGILFQREAWREVEEFLETGRFLEGRERGKSLAAGPF